MKLQESGSTQFRANRSQGRISDVVHAELENYFAQMNGHEVDGLYDLVIAEVERPLLQCVLFHCAGNQSKAARVLGINRGTLRKKLQQHRIDNNLGEEEHEHLANGCQSRLRSMNR